MSTDIRSERVISPAYVAYPTFKNFIGHLKEVGVPSRIDKSVMSTMSGGTQSHLSSTLKFLGLVSAEQTPDKYLTHLVESHGTDEWQYSLKEVLSVAYEDIVDTIDLTKATPHQLDKCFESVGLKAVMVDKCVRFYLSALEDAGVEVSPHFAKRRPKATRKPRAKAKPSPASMPKIEADSSPAKDTLPEGMIEYPLHLSGGRMGVIRVPANITAADCKMIELTLPLVQALASSNSVE